MFINIVRKIQKINAFVFAHGLICQISTTIYKFITNDGAAAMNAIAGTRILNEKNLGVTLR